jgi:hypothetical protein
VKLLINPLFIPLSERFLPTDTPWDEPTKKSPEFCRYVSGEIYSEDPWNRLGSTVLCASSSIMYA